MAPIFEYDALSMDGKSRRGLVEAENSKAARLKLKKQGLTVTGIHEKNAAKPGAAAGGVPFLSGRVSQQDVAMMTRQLASLIKANIPLVEALNALVEQMEKPTLKVILAQVRQDVNEGSSLAKALVKHPKAFDNIFVNMVEAGESSGTLGLVMLRLAELKEAQMRLRGKVISGMTYPVLMMGIAGILLIAIFAFVIPQLAKVFESMNKPIPPMTKMLMNTSDFVINYWYILLAATIIGLSSFRSYIKSAVGRPKWDAFKLRAPLFGPLIRLIAMTRFSGTMATLLGSGVPILSAMAISKNLVESIPIANAIQNARENITEGQSIADPLKKSGEFPPMVIHMITIGEKTGELPDMLSNVAEVIEEQVNARIERMTSLLEPMMIIFMGIIVGFIVIAIFVPLLDMSDIK
ncbi:type II secretion system inner membrane protein GspF [bacterium]|nr:type II secretion system inner membrane protein GspF [bacterium]